MIFLTVGTQFPFDRLIKSVDEVVSQNGGEEEIFAQIGDSSYRPHNIESVPSLEKEAFDQCIKQASAIVSHAGMGTIIMALDNRKPLLIMPRLKKYGEVVNDHQVAIAQKFEQLGHLLVAYSEDELPDKLHQLKSFVPKPRQNKAKVVADRIARFLDEVSGSGKL